jgi:hypothetical protein
MTAPAGRWINTKMSLRIDATGEHRDEHDQPYPDGWVFMVVDNGGPLRDRGHPGRSHHPCGDLGPDAGSRCARAAPSSGRTDRGNISGPDRASEQLRGILP